MPGIQNDCTRHPDLVEQMGTFRCLKLRVEIRASRAIDLPPYLGSTLRGAFGMALLHSACALRRQQCPECVLRSTCIYSYTFETPLPGTADVHRRYAKAPHPFVLNLETGCRTIVPEGGTLVFGFTLIGRAAQFLPYFVYAFQRMGELGIGRGRGTFELIQIHTVGADDKVSEQIFDEGRLRMPAALLGLSEARQLAARMTQDAVRLRFVTPVRLVRNGEVCGDVGFPFLVRNLLRRLNNLAAFHCGGSMDPAGGPLIDEAEKVRLIEGDLRWYDWERYSRRQDRHMKMGGLLGHMVFEGDLGNFLPWLVLGSWVNLGKGTSFGLGRYRLEAVAPNRRCA